MVLIELLEKLIGVDVGSWLPAVMCFGETFPPDKVLQLSLIVPCLEYSLHFPLWLPFDKVRCGFLVLVAV